MDSEYLRFVLALILVLGLILLLAWAMRRFGAGGLTRPGSKRRLHVVETAVAGPRHRLVLVRRDQTEHLLLLGPSGDIIVEQGIAAPPNLGAQKGKASFEQAMAAERDMTQKAGSRLDLPTLRAERSAGDEGQPR
jgi:flagellar protein FliO/FliZ